MGKDYTLDSIKNLIGILRINYKEYTGDPPQAEYYILRLEWRGKGVNGGASKEGMEYYNDGAPQSVKFTPKQIYQRIKTVLGNVVANKLRDLYVDLINDDISEV